jgi:hypothetical protein
MKTKRQMKNFKIVSERGTEVAYLKRIHGGVSIIFVGGMIAPMGRGTAIKPYKLERAALYTERTAKAWVKSLTRAGNTGYKIWRTEP